MEVGAVKQAFNNEVCTVDLSWNYHVIISNLVLDLSMIAPHIFDSLIVRSFKKKIPSTNFL